MKAWNVWMDKYNPHVDKSDYYAPYGFLIVADFGRYADNREYSKRVLYNAPSELDIVETNIGDFQDGLCSDSISSRVLARS